MPIYVYECDDGHKTDKMFMGNPFRPGFMCLDSTFCEKCGKNAKRIITAANFTVDKEFVSEHLFSKPTLVRNKKHHKELMRKAGVMQKNDPFG